MVTGKVERLVDNRWGHPCFSTRNLLVCFAMRWVQGRDGVFFCGSYTVRERHVCAALSPHVRVGCARSAFAGHATESRVALGCQTPGNGHDLSLLSGLVAAHCIGAPYPFASYYAAARDFELLRSIMVGGLLLTLAKWLMIGGGGLVLILIRTEYTMPVNIG
eukprot:COSAG01_NODE_3069_length_6640_cov_2.893441_8_plen_162_part_00